MHYLKLDLYFPWCAWNRNFPPIAYHPPLGPVLYQFSLEYLVSFGTFQRIVTRRQAQRRTEQQDSSLLTPPCTCGACSPSRHVQRHPLAWSNKAPQLSLKAEGIVYADPRIFIPLPQSSKSLSWYLLLQTPSLARGLSRTAPHRNNSQHIH